MCSQIRKEIGLSILEKTLTQKERRAINKFNPARLDRDRAIRALFQRGVSIDFLSELSGLSGESLRRITHGMNTYRRSVSVKEETAQGEAAGREMPTPEEIKAIQRSNPDRFERDSMIQTLFDRGISSSLIAKLSGFSRGSIHRIATAWNAYQRKPLTQAGKSEPESDFTSFGKMSRTLVSIGKKLEVYRRRNYSHGRTNPLRANQGGSGDEDGTDQKNILGEGSGND